MSDDEWINSEPSWKFGDEKPANYNRWAAQANEPKWEFGEPKPQNWDRWKGQQTDTWKFGEEKPADWDNWKALETIQNQKNAYEQRNRNPGAFSEHLRNEFSFNMRHAFSGEHEMFRQSDWILDE